MDDTEIMRQLIPINFQQAVMEETPEGHFYRTPTGNRYASSTTILGATNAEKDEILKAWRVRVGREVAQYITDESAIIGTEVHTMIEYYINGCFLPISPRLISQAHFNNLKSLVNKIDNFYGNEIRLWDDKLGIAGTADNISYYNGKLSVVDYKTKRRPQKEEYLWDHYLQLSSYAYMFQKLEGVKVEQVVLLISSETNSRQEFIVDPRNYFIPLVKRIKMYYEKM